MKKLLLIYRPLTVTVTWHAATFRHNNVVKLL